MITFGTKKNAEFFVDFAWEKDAHIRTYKLGVEKVFHGKYLETYYLCLNQQAVLLVGCGKEKELGLLEVKEICATIAAKCKEYEAECCSIDFAAFLDMLGRDALMQGVLGLCLGTYKYSCKKPEEEAEKRVDCEFQLLGTERIADAQAVVEEAQNLAKDIIFARDMVNMPGNMLRPMDFNRRITEYVSDVEIEAQTFVYGQLKTMGLQGLYGIGGSSEFPPCLLVLRYKGDPSDSQVYGLIGKGVTCDTGGYCLKGAKSMSGIKGDMGGAAAVVGAIHAIARKKLKINVTACLPLCENRISPSSHLPGDVITSYSGKTVEILNTDAEGRLILADAMSYGIKMEKITKVLDIATLTGAAWSALGYTIGGAMSDDEEFYGTFERGLAHGTERYLRFPFGKEHRKMIESDVADIKNIGGDCCGVITAGLFIREFAEEIPWIHLDIAGTAWSNTPQYAFESKGATGAGVLSIYNLLNQVCEDKNKG